MPTASIRQLNRPAGGIVTGKEEPLTLRRYDAVADAGLPRRTRYERRPAQPEAAMPITVSALYGLATTIGAAAFVMASGAARHWLWIAALLGALMFLMALTWRLQVQDEQSVIERETTIEVDDAIRPAIIEGARGNTIRRGNFIMDRKYWQRLYNLAQDGRRVTRDAVVAADAMPRELYHAVFDETTAEMRRVGLLDDDNRMTAAWRDFHRSTVALPPTVQSFVRSRNGNEYLNGGGVGGSE